VNRGKESDPILQPEDILPWLKPEVAKLQSGEVAKPVTRQDLELINHILGGTAVIKQ